MEDCNDQRIAAECRGAESAGEAGPRTQAGGGGQEPPETPPRVPGEEPEDGDGEGPVEPLLPGQYDVAFVFICKLCEKSSARFDPALLVPAAARAGVELECNFCHEQIPLEPKPRPDLGETRRVVSASSSQLGSKMARDRAAKQKKRIDRARRRRER